MRLDIIDDFRLSISDRIDGHGFLYGRADLGERRSCRVDILPPAPFRGEQAPCLTLPDPASYCIYLDGKRLLGCPRGWGEIAPAIKLAMETFETCNKCGSALMWHDTLQCWYCPVCDD